MKSYGKKTGKIRQYALKLYQFVHETFLVQKIKNVKRTVQMIFGILVNKIVLACTCFFHLSVNSTEK